MGKKYREWEERDWMRWLLDNLTFPFKARRFDNLCVPFPSDQRKVYNNLHHAFTYPYKNIFVNCKLDIRI